MSTSWKLMQELFPERIASFKAESEAQGKAAEARSIALRLLRTKFHDLPDELVAQVRDAEPAWCEELTERLLDAPKLPDLLAWARSHRSAP